jgi:hypothetical protein
VTGQAENSTTKIAAFLVTELAAIPVADWVASLIVYIILILVDIFQYLSDGQNRRPHAKNSDRFGRITGDR